MAKIIKRESREKQDTPRMQLIALIQSAQGDIGNLGKGMPGETGRKERIDNCLERAQKIIGQMSDIDVWDTEPYPNDALYLKGI